MEYQEYEAIPALRASEMKYLLRSPAHYKQMKDHPPADTSAKKLGRAFHAALLEPEKFRAGYTCMDDSRIIAEIGGAKPRGTNAYRDWKAEFEANNAGKEILPIESLEAVEAMTEAILSNVLARELLEADGDTEVSLTWCDDKTGVPIKARPDRVLASSRIIDIKTCDDARLQAFERSLLNFGYYLQAAVYTEAVIAERGNCDKPFVFVCVESEAPYAVAIYELDAASLEIGRMHMRRCIDLFKACSDAGFWPGYEEEIRKISLPNWAQI